ncbi:hypothetical protein GIB67_031359 [Kingdonia uniflora]|uniref:Transposase n=1 Tax=Kingdonia uniflora TaxID=39325 RepID=A0A7J7MAY2_9MAGN|nr:hypothetical protein GIB67_031359 [Kingdonia uniflora]
MAPGTTSRRLWVQSTSQIAVNTENDSSVAACKRKKGKAVNNKVINYKVITSKKPRIEIHQKYARSVKRWSSQFVREVELVARQHGPLTDHDWSRVEDDVGEPLCDRIMGGTTILLRWLAQEKWDAYYDWFGREKFKKISEQNSCNRLKLPTNHCGGSKPFVKYLEEFRDSKTQQPIGMIELYHRTHLSSKGWTSLIDEENYQQLKDESEAEGIVPMTEDKILNRVLGVRSGYSKGLGHGVLPQSSKRVSSIQLEEEVQRRRDEEEF